jgi:hypothetical protein
MNICLAEGLEISKAQGVNTNSCNLLYYNLTSLYTQHQYSPNHICNSNETRIQARRQSGARVIAKRESHQVFNTIPKFKEWLTTNCAMNVTRGSIPGFYIFRSEKIIDEYIKHYKFGTCIAIQTKAWMTSFLFKEFLSIFKKSFLGGVFPSNRHILIIDGHGSHVNLEAIEQAQ